MSLFKPVNSKMFYRLIFDSSFRDLLCGPWPDIRYSIANTPI